MGCLGIIQARLGSQRLPGKALRKLNGTPMLGYVISRVSQCPVLDQLVVATSNDPSDDPIAEYCNKNGVKCFRGALENVRKRFEDLLKDNSPESFARINGDSPLYDPVLISKAYAIFTQGKYEIVSNAFKKTYPTGCGVEIIDTKVFLESNTRAPLAAVDEHVTSHFYSHADRFKHFSLITDRDNSAVRLAVDTEEDFLRVEALIQELTRPLETYSWRELADIYRAKWKC